MRDASPEPEPSPPSTPVAPRQQARRPSIPLGELPSTASYAEMLALLRVRRFTSSFPCSYRGCSKTS